MHSEIDTSVCLTSILVRRKMFLKRQFLFYRKTFYIVGVREVITVSTTDWNTIIV